MPGSTRRPIAVARPMDLAELAESAAEPAPAPGQPPAACASCACDLSFSRQQIGLAQEILAGSELTQFAYTLNLVVKAFRIALAAEPGR